ncbi:MAG: heme A synthase [Deltaproteobacteria bacterium]|nr:heme A synthase [Deltaproteobacteria bacterium]
MRGRMTVGLLFLLLVWGNLVAGLKAGLACPDWPLCHGKVLPPLRLDIYMEFLHRVIAAVAGISLIALCVRRFRDYRGSAKAVPILAAGFLAVEVVLGGAVVLFGIPVQLTTVHFMLGLAVFLLAVYMASFDGVRYPPAFSLSGRSALFFGIGILVFLLAGLGAYVRHADAGLACAEWPLCADGLFPKVLTGHVLIHFSHRVLAALVFLTVIALYAAVVLDRRLDESRGLARALLLLAAGQVAVGGLVVLTKLYYLSTALHMAIALGMLVVLFHMWAREVKREELLPWNR